MHRFRTRRKTAGAASGADNEERGGKTSISSKSFKRSKKQQPLPQPAIDLTNALPSSDDFRTSLLMPNLSARFSMLRQQDDPTTLIGKASDDSVLYPRRASRLNILSDIAEVSSINESVRPPFAYGRTESFASADGYGTDDDSAYGGSVLGRAKPGEGNNLFGGRQKVYKIPVSGTASTKDLGNTNTRFFYEDDVHKSAFQKLRQKEREQERDMDHGLRERGPDGAVVAEAKDRANSPPLAGYNRNRETSSSTNSGPSFGRTSTAATSIVSQGGTTPALPSSAPVVPGAPGNDRAAAKSRRLYEQGLDQHLHEQQSSALTRMEQLSRLRMHGTSTPPPGQGSMTTEATTQVPSQERHDRQAGIRTGPVAFRAASPTPAASPANLNSFKFGLEESRPSRQSPNVNYPQSPPLSPVSPEGDEASVFPAAIQPNDRGKATALGTFNKPKLPYNEEQYSQRQLQLQKGRESPSSRHGSPPYSNYRTSDESQRKQSEDSNGTSPSMDKIAHQQTRSGRPSMDTFASGTASKHEPNADMDLGSQGTFLAPMSDVSSGTESETEGERLVGVKKGRFQGMSNAQHQATAPLGVHPALRSPPAQRNFDVSQREDFASVAQPTQISKASPTFSKPVEAESDSPTLGPTPGLSGLVRQHLRNDSGQSSVYDTPSPIHSRFPSADMRRGDDPLSGQPQYAQGSTWEMGSRANGSTSPLPAIRSLQSLQPSHGPTSQPAAFNSSPTKNRGQQMGAFGTDGQARNTDPADEWAQRRRVVQENLRRAQLEAAAHPTSGMHISQQQRGSPSKGPKAHGMGVQPAVTPSEAKAENPAKAMKMLGISGSEAKSMTANRKPAGEDHWREEEERMLRSIVRPPKNPQSIPTDWQQIRHDAQKEQEQRFQQYNQASRVPNQRTSPPSSRDSERGSPVVRHPGDPSPGMYGPFGATAPKVMAGGAGATGRKQSDTPQQFLDISEPGTPILNQGSPFSAFNNERSASKSTAAEHFESKNLQPLKTSSQQQATGSSGPSPMPPFSAASSSTTTTLVSPTREGVQMASHKPFSHRKKSVNKGDISEPTFLSCTSSISTVSLPPGASLSNGASDIPDPPPVPPLNPRRKHRLGHFARGSPATDTVSMPPNAAHPPNDPGMHSDSGEGPRSVIPYHRRNRLRKTSSEGGNMNAKARMQAFTAPSPSIPTFPNPNIANTPARASPTMVNGMF
ncbi:MAG: hypothetical protein M1833_003933 [Piccolia ochrophora]|nr:MAG: hypothetical protein M1833_003933 [Piccolia ochrophora]